MAMKLYSDSDISDIADAIRSKNGTSDTYKVSQMASAIQAIPTGITPTGTKSILLTEAGKVTEDVTEYAYAEVNAVKSATASGAVASFSDGAEDVPMDSCLVNIEPVQSGSGDPSPSNVRPISGWSNVNVTRTGKNLLAINATSQTTMDLTVVANSDGSITVNGTVNGGNVSFTHLTGAVAPQKMYAGSTITLSGLSGYTINQAYLQLIYMGEDESTISIVNYNTAVTYTFTQNATLRGIYLSFRNGTTFTNQTIYPQLEIGSTATSYEPYVTPTVYPVSLGQTVYGGTLDVVSGVLTVTDGYIASYAGETLPSTWISDRDVYVQGTTPTTGAQVVYELASPTTVQLTPTEVTTLLGSNSVWADSGDIAVGYKADVYLSEGGITPTGTKSITITSNGTTTEDVTNYASASVNVPNSYSASDEGKVVSNGALVAQTSDTVTQNGTVDTTLINSLTVNVSGGGGYTWNEVTMTSTFSNASNAANTLFGSITGKGGLAYLYGKDSSAFINNQLYELCQINAGAATNGGCVRYRNGAYNNAGISGATDATCEVGDVYKVLLADI